MCVSTAEWHTWPTFSPIAFLQSVDHTMHAATCNSRTNEKKNIDEKILSFLSCLLRTHRTDFCFPNMRLDKMPGNYCALFIFFLCFFFRHVADVITRLPCTGNTNIIRAESSGKWYEREADKNKQEEVLTLSIYFLHRKSHTHTWHTRARRITYEQDSSVVRRTSGACRNESFITRSHVRLIFLPIEWRRPNVEMWFIERVRRRTVDRYILILRTRNCV